MGISGLLSLLKSIQKVTHVKEFKGLTVGVDAYGWLHRGAIACAIELAQGKPTSKYVDFAMHRVRMLMHFGVTPYVVFDGDRLPSKGVVAEKRGERRQESKTVGLELLSLGKIAQAYSVLQKAVDVTPLMAKHLIEELKRNDIQFMVAPYEADPQLAYLEREGIIDAILSEDSDLLVFGTKTLLTKLDQYGECMMIRQADFTACHEINLNGWSVENFRHMAMLSGCDYLPGIPRMGLKTAYRLLRKHSDINRIVRLAQLDGKFQIPRDYLTDFKRAELTFLHQWVFDPRTKSLVNFTSLPPDLHLEELPFIGPHVDSETARLVANGQINAQTKERFPAEISSQRSSKLHAGPKTPKEIPSDKENASIQKIDSFFKPKRTPLAELDPNSFTPSPSQQRLLQRQESRSWRSVPSATPSRSNESVVIQHGQGQISHQPVISASQGLKRRRLCSEEDVIPRTLVENSPVKRSKFFTSKSPHSFSSKKRQKENSSAKIEIYSDDSTEDALRNLPDIAVNPIPTPPETQETMACFANGLQHSIQAEPEMTTARYVKETPPNDAAHIEGDIACKPSQLGTSLRDFAFQPCPVSLTQKKLNRIGESDENDPLFPRDGWISGAPLFGREADTAFEEEENERIPESSPPVPENQEEHTEELRVLDQDQEDNLEKQKQTLNAGEDDASITTQLHPKGSEDLLVIPDSEASSDLGSEKGEAIQTPHARTKIKTLDLDRFAFSANIRGTFGL